MGARAVHPYVQRMISLHIEHAITDLATWTGAFRALAEGRRQMGVTKETVRQPIDDERYIVVDLDFDTSEQAEAFLGFLRDHVWANPENAPALVGTPEGRVLQTVALT